MRAIYLFIALLFWSADSLCQAVKEKLIKAMRQLESDPQLRHAMIGFCVVNQSTGKLIFEKNAQVGLTAASTQKIITSAAAFELLGKEYRYKTVFRLKRNSFSDNNPDLEIESAGDPTFGSSRFNSTVDSIILKNFLNEFNKKVTGKFSGNLIIHDFKFGQPLPRGYIWEDIGNYYGAGSYQLNWKENQFELYFNSTMTRNTQVARVVPAQPHIEFRNLVEADPATKGDEIYVFCPPESLIAYLEGKMPVNKKDFKVGAAMADPARTFGEQLKKIGERKLFFNNTIITRRTSLAAISDTTHFIYDSIYTHFSPPLDSINYHFMQKSINLYGESLVKTISYVKSGHGSMEKGVQLIQDFFASKGIDKRAISIADGSGLSPQNRVTADALVKVLQYAYYRPWFTSFYNALPLYNGMKMKSGSIAGVRSFAGYHRSANGQEYTFSIIINNFDGSASGIVQKMYKLLDILK